MGDNTVVQAAVDRHRERPAGLPGALVARGLRDRYLAKVAGARLPNRSGTHRSTAFATGLVLDAARAVGDEELAATCVDAALRWHRGGVGYGVPGHR